MKSKGKNLLVPLVPGLAVALAAAWAVQGPGPPAVAAPPRLPGTAWPPTPTPPIPLTVYYYRAGQATAVARHGALTGDPQADAVILLTALLAGPTTDEQASGIASPLPTGARLVTVRVAGDEVTVDLDLPLPLVLDATRSDAIVEQVVKTLHPLGLHRVHVRAVDERGALVPISDLIPRLTVPAPAVPPNDDPAPAYAGQPPAYGQGQPPGALSGKTVWISAGHGWLWNDTLSQWMTQRPNLYGVIEDLANAEAVNYYLARYLWNAGADVWLVRERGMNDHEVVVDNDAGAPGYVETGTWNTSTSTGYEGSTYRYVISEGGSSATATWTPDLPQAGAYAVWAWYRHGTNRPVDTRYEIHHAGGVTVRSISQEVHGQTWRYLGEYVFAAGTAGHVTLTNESGDVGQAVIADAVRFGAGMGSIAAPGGASGEPRWEEASLYWVQYQGAPPEVYVNDVTARPRYAEWETAKGAPGEAENAVYVSWHTNAANGTGTESYIHDTEPTTGSVELQDWVHTELVHDLRAAWNPGWVDRGQKTANFGELRELDKIPGVLLEVAFHDTEDPGDVDDLREPAFRQIAARAVFQGIVKYYADREGTAVHLLPEPPTRLAARSTGVGQVTLTWAPPPCCDGVVGDAAASYKVYQSTDGRAFDDGVETISPSLTLTGLPTGTLRFFRVTALNQGGESFPTPVVAVGTPPDGGAPSVLVVDGFDRLDQEALIPQWESATLGTARRMFLERMNRYDYAVEHAEALGACGLAFDGAVDEAVAAGDVALGDYPVVDWFVGENVTASLKDGDRARLAAYLDAGGGLLISGAEIGRDLVENGRDPAFYRDYLRAVYLGDDAGTLDFGGVAGGPFDGLAGSVDDGAGDTYHVDRPDRLAATQGSTVALAYQGGTGDGAAVAYDGVFRVVYVGFPLETVTDPATRTALVCAAVDVLLRPRAAGCVLSPDHVATADPGQVIAYTHILTNTGPYTDTFELTYDSSQGWAQVAPASAITLTAGATQTVFVTITVPAGAISSTQDTTTVTATSQANGRVSAAATNTTTVRQVAGVRLAPDHQGAVHPGMVVAYTHTLTNAGNGLDAFVVAHASSQTWVVTYDTPIALDAGQATTLTVSVTVPVVAISGTVDSLVITVTSQADGNIFAAIVDTTTVTDWPWHLYLPIARRAYAP